MKERLKLVESFSELRAGMIVVYKPCQVCRAAHRAMLLSLVNSDGMVGPSGNIFTGPAWTFEPPLSCEWDWGPPMTRARITDGAVTGRTLYRVLDGLEDFDTQTSKRSLKKPQSLEKSR